MTPARSLAASVVALGFASTLTAPSPVVAAPAPCERAENYAAQSGAEVLRIDRLEVRRPRPGTRPDARNDAAGTRRHRAATPNDDAESNDRPVDGATDRILGAEKSSVGAGDDDGLLNGGLGILGSAALDGPGEAASAETGDGAQEEREGGGGIGGGGIGGGELPRAPQPAGDAQARNATVRGVGLGDTRTAFVATAQIKSAAMARILDGEADGQASLTEPVLQEAPPSNGAALAGKTPARRVGPLRIGSGAVYAHARWDAGMACGNAGGEVTRSRADLASTAIAGGGNQPLVRVPEKMSSLSLTAVERLDGSARTVASATVTAGRVELAGGKVRLRVLRSPSLFASMAADGACEIRYQPAVVEVSGDGIDTTRLSAARDHIDVAFGPEKVAISPEKRTAGSAPEALGGLRAGSPLPLPAVPDVPSIGAPRTESAPTAGPGTKLRISLGELRQAKRGYAVAARATAIQVAITQGAPASGRTKPRYGGTTRPEASLDLDFGLLEAAAVAPEAEGVSPAGVGAGGGLPVTGASVGKFAAAGVGLLLLGTLAVLLGLRRRRSHP